MDGTIQLMGWSGVPENESEPGVWLLSKCRHILDKRRTRKLE
jgi:hypothetical protein